MKCKYITLVIALLFFRVTYTTQAQCNSEQYTNRAIKEIPFGFNFSKSFKIDRRNNSRKKIKYTLVLSKHTTYSFSISGSKGNSIIATIYDTKKRKIATSFYNEKYFSSCSFKCRASGIYYIEFTFEKKGNDCGAAAMSFKR